MQFDIRSTQVHLSLLVHQGRFINFLMNSNFEADYDILLEEEKGYDFKFWD